MVNQQVLQGNWNEIKGKLRKKWGQLTNEDLQSFDGNIDHLVGLIQRKTGEGRDAVERFLDDAAAQGSSFAAQAGDQFREYGEQAAEAIHEGARQAGETFRQGYDAVRQSYSDAEEMVRQRPSQAAAICFGVGVLTGLLVAVMFRRS